MAQVDASAPLVASENVAVVKTESGLVQGFIHHGIFTYRGIPYAKAARFMPPEKPDRWEGVRTAFTYGFICPQRQSDQINDRAEFLLPHRYWPANEKCQNLNVWSPGINDGKKRPVMVWFHGGGFVFGSSIALYAYDGENLSRKGDAVVVTVNHRLNVLGFLDLAAYGPEYKYSGNVSIMDLVAALQWVKANIANFGGDPENVTIFGQSGGGGKVLTLLATPAAKGLFQKAIVESGAAHGLGMTLADPNTTRRVAAATLQNLHIDPSNLQQLSTISYEELSNGAGKAMRSAGGDPSGGMGWTPIHDGDYIPSQPFETHAPEQSKDIPLLIGSNLNEMSANPTSPELRDRDKWTLDQAKSYLRQKHPENADALIAAYQKAYPNLKPGEWFKLDNVFRPGTVVTANAKADQRGAPVYNYLFAWRSPVLDGSSGAPHDGEIPFAFNNIALTEQMNGGGKDAYDLSQKVSQAWINFARTGNPNNSGLPNWPAYTHEGGGTMIFDNKCDVRFNYDKVLLTLLYPDMSF
jgi:para-nitrobenzyl esterase